MIPKFIAHNTIAIGRDLQITALDEQGQIWLYEARAQRTSDPTDGQWTRLSNARVVEQGKEQP